MVRNKRFLKRTKITNKIDYVEPDSMTNFTSCAGIIVQSKKKVMIDVNMGAKETPGLMEEEKPEIAIITHYHLDQNRLVHVSYIILNGGSFVLQNLLTGEMLELLTT